MGSGGILELFFSFSEARRTKKEMFLYAGMN